VGLVRFRKHPGAAGLGASGGGLSAGNTSDLPVLGGGPCQRPLGHRHSTLVYRSPLGPVARSRSPRVGVVVLGNLVVTVLAAGVAAEWSPGVVTAVVKEAVPVPSLRRPPT